MSEVLNKIEEKGRVEGRAEGRVDGRAEGRAEGRVEGRAEGKDEERVRVAEEMLKENEPIEKIRKYSQLADNVISEIAKKIGVAVIL